HFAAGVIGVLFGELGEISAVMELVKNALGLGFRSGVGAGVLGIHGDQNVADLDLCIHLIVAEVVLIIILNLGIGDRCGGRGQIGDREGDVLNFASLGD